MHTHAGEKGTTNGMPLPKAATFPIFHSTLSHLSKHDVQLYMPEINILTSSQYNYISHFIFSIFSKLIYPPLN